MDRNDRHQMSSGAAAGADAVGSSGDHGGVVRVEAVVGRDGSGGVGRPACDPAVVPGVDRERRESWREKVNTDK